METAFWGTILVTALGLSADACAVSMTNGMCYKNQSALKIGLASGLTFGIFQGIMPLIGFYIGKLFESYATSLDHWIALILLGFIGGKMIFESLKSAKEDDAKSCPLFSAKTLLIQGVATSIDALAVGISFAFFAGNGISIAFCIGIVTFIMSFVGVLLGRKFGDLLSDKAQIVGGIILVGIGVKIFLDHTVFS